MTALGRCPPRHHLLRAGDHAGGRRRRAGARPQAEPPAGPATLQPEVERVDGVRVIRTYRTREAGWRSPPAWTTTSTAEHDARPHRPRRRPRPRRVRGRRARGVTVVLTKWLAYHYGDRTTPSDLADRAALTLRPGQATASDAALAEHEREVGGLLGAQRGASGTARRAAQQALHFNLFTLLQASLAQRGPRRAGQGPDRHGLRGPLLLGHRGVRAAVPDPHLARRGPQPAHAPGADAPRRPPPGPRGRLRRGALPVAHDQRPGGLRLLRRRHGAVPHRRRHRVRPRPVRQGHRRHRPAVPARRRAAGRDGSDVGRPRLLLASARADSSSSTR